MAAATAPVAVVQPAGKAADDEADEVDEERLLLPREPGHEKDTAYHIGSADATRREQCLACGRARAGMLVALAGTFAFSLMTVSVRVLPLIGYPVPMFMIVTVRGCIVSGVALLSLFRRKVNPMGPRPYRGWLLLRGICGFLSLSGFYFGLTNLRVADAVVMQKTSPVITTLIAHLWLGEPFEVFDFGAALLCLVGVAMVSQSAADASGNGHPLPQQQQSQTQHQGDPDSGTPRPGEGGTETPWVRLVAVAITLASAVTAAIAYTTIRRLTTDPRQLRVDPMVLVLYFAFICVPGGLLGLWAQQTIELDGTTATKFEVSEVNSVQWAVLIAGCGFLGFVGERAPTRCSVRVRLKITRNLETTRD